MNGFGNRFRLSIWGESHGEEVGITCDGIPAGIALCAEDFLPDLARRKAGARGTTPRIESDTPHIVSGLYRGKTTGAPLTVTFTNGNTRPSDYEAFLRQPRPSHADYCAAVRFQGYNDPRGSGHFSARLTVALTAAGVVAKKLLPESVTFTTEPVEIGGCRERERFEEVIAAAQRDGDSVGGVIECRIGGVPTGWGEPFFDSVESVMSHLLFSIPAVKGVEFGSGFHGARLRGSQNNDPLIDGEGHTAGNHAGGINGGLTNGNDIVVRVAVKPTASIAREQQTYDFSAGEVRPLRIGGRHDVCVALRGAVVVEAAAAIALAELRR